MMKAKDYYILMENIFYENENNIKDALEKNSELKTEIESIITNEKNININNFIKVLKSEKFKEFFEEFKNNNFFKEFFKKFKNNNFFKEFKNDNNEIKTFLKEHKDEPKDSMISESAVLFFTVQGIFFLIFVLLNAFEVNLNIAVILGKLSEKLSNIIKK